MNSKKVVIRPNLSFKIAIVLFSLLGNLAESAEIIKIGSENLVSFYSVDPICVEVPEKGKRETVGFWILELKGGHRIKMRVQNISTIHPSDTQTACEIDKRQHQQSLSSIGFELFHIKNGTIFRKDDPKNKNSACFLLEIIARIQSENDFEIIHSQDYQKPVVCPPGYLNAAPI